MNNQEKDEVLATISALDQMIENTHNKIEDNYKLIREMQKSKEHYQNKLK